MKYKIMYNITYSIQAAKEDKMLSALKNFGVTFLISAILFGIIAYFATGLVTNTVGQILDEEDSSLNNIINNEDAASADETEPDNSVVETNEKVPEGESFNFLVAVNDYRPDLYTDYTPDISYMYNTDWTSISPTETIGCLSTDYREINLSTIVLVRIDKEKREFVYTYFPSDTRVYTSSGYHTLSEVYNLYGIDRISEYVSAMTGLEIKYNVLINGYDLDEIYSLLGSVSVNIGSDIYTDGTYNTMQYETTIEHVEADGSKWTEHKPNTYLIGKGDVAVTEDNLYTLVSTMEHSASELSLKEAYSIEMLSKYLNYLAGLEESKLKIVMAQLIMNESEWGNIEGLETTAPETEAPETEAQSYETATAETEEEDKSSRWIQDTFEPEGAMVSTNFTLNDFDSIYEMLCAVTYFENKTVSYPMTYYAADEDTSEYFDADTNSGISLFMDYRK
jgi:anionic cell wall polymer biosynthesis LytR-Cps2A-Psr (LCP) family protein